MKVRRIIDSVVKPANLEAKTAVKRLNRDKKLQLIKQVVATQQAR